MYQKNFCSTKITIVVRKNQNYYQKNKYRTKKINIRIFKYKCICILKYLKRYNNMTKKSTHSYMINLIFMFCTFNLINFHLKFNDCSPKLLNVHLKSCNAFWSNLIDLMH